MVLESFWVDRQFTVLPWCHLCNVSAPKWSDKLSGADGVIAECGEWVMCIVVYGMVLCVVYFSLWHQGRSDGHKSI